MQDQQDTPNIIDRLHNSLGWLMAIARSVALPAEVVLHTGFGERYIGLQGAAAVLIIVVFGAFFPGDDLLPLYGFWVIYLVLSFAARSEVLLRRGRGRRPHSFYSGRPRLLRLFPRTSETTLKQFIEPLLVVLTGVITAALNPPLGSYLVIAGLGWFLKDNILVMHERTRALDLHDSVIEQQMVTSRFSSMRGGRA